MSWHWAAFYALAVLIALFGVAALVERGRWAPARHPTIRHRAYTLALGVYCSSWTFYGAVGSAVREGWNYLPIYVAPVLLLLFAPRFLRALSQAVANEQAKTLSDFIAARFDHDPIVARLVTVIALLGTIPYVALQFRSIGKALSLVTGQPVAVPAMIVAAPLLALFAILFGARRFELAGRSEGLVFAIGAESLIKAVALIAVAAMATGLLIAAPPAQLAAGLATLGERFHPGHISFETLAIMVISVFAVLILPRQFYMAVVEARTPDDLVEARHGLAAFIAIMAAMALPIALAGVTLLPAGESPDNFVLDLPTHAGNPGMLVLALIGGIAAAASMVIVDSTALATMVSNDLIFPTLHRRGAAGPGGGDAAILQAGALGRRMLRVRRISIMAVMWLALAWALLVSPRESLASMGYVAFAAMAQISPHLLLATYAERRDVLAARVSLGVGMALWLYTLALPPILPQPWLDALRHGPLDPLRLFGVGQASPLVHGVVWSLGANVLAYGLFAARAARPSPRLRIAPFARGVSDIGDLHRLVASFVGEDAASREFPADRHGRPIDRKSARRARELIARVVGAASARALVASALAGGQMSLGDVTRLLDEGSQSLSFSRQLLAATFENVDAGISVVDAEMNLVAWNSRYLDIFGYPPGLVQVGVPVAELIRHNARHGDFGPGEVEFHVAKRLEHMRRGSPHGFERRRNDGRVIKTVGGPMPGGGYVMSFTDVSEEARVRDELETTLAELESRVADRTRELSAANALLARATRDKTRFLAAASHDLLQPLHAARLFAAALARDPGTARQDLVARVDRAIVGAEALLRALLDISKLDAGGVQPDCAPIDLAPFLADLAEGIRPLAEEKGLTLRLGPLAGAVVTDPGLLRSVLQNFLTNAVRYTDRGGIVLGVRRRGEDLRIDVIDSGIGIAPDRHDEVFGEFTRLGQVEAEGLGLGLAIAQRIVRLLGGRIELASTPGRGSRFSLVLPRGEAAPPVLPSGTVPTPAEARPLTVLVVDNEPEIVAATAALLAAMGHTAHAATTAAEARALAGEVDAALVDFQLGDGADGLDLAAALRRTRPGLPVALVTAERDSQVAARAAAMGVPVLAKPADPATIEAFLGRV
ncbi:PAS-domain containing protein [Novosphingobium flavum]|uniref:histidine kinase n=1 Tax=Novosphingobium aerophilum TaxID=2839843 RepID=A0A7X1KCB5_9SPHN|nr:PAS-domain containing protein [Novosphingobium aerophilum]MBC2651922.1 PAS-domain containing protein [Novosphingobium aerophilum]MBC2661679.1 PAS-domain containing protein [Novosphingobium aerophilum]